MSDTITVRGFLGTSPELRTTSSGLMLSSFRLGSTPRWFDRERSEWVSGTTNWYTVTCFRQLGEHTANSLAKGDPVIVTGRPRIRSWQNDDGATGISVEIDAETVGHDLTFGTTHFARIRPAAEGSPESAPASGAAASSAEESSPNVNKVPGGDDSSSTDSGQTRDAVPSAAPGWDTPAATAEAPF
ncbi:single-stranded DNA-binding protein [Nesterenkonia flava]|uniref:Single-stranded DNA-binding protein n=1 Tax=Nesterenkonia flava TaxID=469799 RepID=A0ABU1FW00_9MICC|nr:single-stranded DNA-binding protein [Nesterenkonia flava]MDR5712855.1 single-stranded DNA-binding protein [Nesterenkonia flava]